MDLVEKDNPVFLKRSVIVERIHQHIKNHECLIVAVKYMSKFVRYEARWKTKICWHIKPGRSTENPISNEMH